MVKSVRRRLENFNDVWSYFIENHIHNARKFRMPNAINERAYKCLVMRIDRKLGLVDVVSSVLVPYAISGNVPCDNEFLVETSRDWSGTARVGVVFIAPDLPWRMAIVSTPSSVTGFSIEALLQPCGGEGGALRAEGGSTMPSAHKDDHPKGCAAASYDGHLKPRVCVADQLVSARPPQLGRLIYATAPR